MRMSLSKRALTILASCLLAVLLCAPVAAFADDTSSTTGGDSAQGLTATPGNSAIVSQDAAAPLQGVFTFTNRASGKRLSVANDGIVSTTNLQQYKSSKTIGQYFALRYDEKTGFYTILAANSGLAVDVANGSKKNGANVRLYEPNGTPAQQWKISVNTDGSYIVRNVNSKKVLAVSGGSSANGANVVQNSGKGDAQHWSIKPVTNWLPNGVYQITLALNNNASIGVKKAATKAGANVQAATLNTKAWAQNWIVYADDKNPGYYTLRNLNSRKMLAVAGGNASSGANVVQATKKASAAQLWKPEVTEDGIVWRSKLDNNLVLGMVKGKSKAGTNIRIYTYKNTAAQKYRLKKANVATLLKSTAFVVRNANAKRVLDAKNGGTTAGTKVQLHKANKTGAQKFRVTKNGKGFSLINVSARKAVQVKGNSFTLRGISKAKAKRWAIKLDLARGTFTIRSASTGKYLANNGGTLTQVSAVSSNDHRWILTPTTADYFRVFLNSGHGWNSNGNGAFDTGAVGLGGQREADYASDLCSRIIKYARDTYGLDIVDSRPYQLAYWKRLPKAVELGCSAIFSVHFDAGGGSGPMTMVGVDGRHPASMTFNNIMGKHLYKALPGLRQRGTSYRNDITCVNGKIPAVLVEVCFMDTPSDLAYYNARKNTVARELAKGLYEASQVQSLRKSA